MFVYSLSPTTKQGFRSPPSGTVGSGAVDNVGAFVYPPVDNLCLFFSNTYAHLSTKTRIRGYTE